MKRKKKTNNVIASPAKVLWRGEAICAPRHPEGPKAPKPACRPGRDLDPSGPSPACRQAGASGRPWAPRNDVYVPLIEKALERVLPSAEAYPPEIHEGMRYAVLNGGKRFRPLLVLAACEAVGGDPEKALLPACAVELIHCYSLVHDDLPALDNDEMRRGLPACHRKFGEALAILIGDALLTRAFELLSEVKPAQKAVALVRELSSAAGTQGMIGGQAVDILTAKNGSAKEIDRPLLDYISRSKTGRLIQASAVLGAVLGTRSSSKIRRIREYGAALGLAFQVVDDIMDGDGYLRLMSAGEAEEKANELIQKAKQEARAFGPRGKGLLALADFLSERMKSSHVPMGS